MILNRALKIFLLIIAMLTLLLGVASPLPAENKNAVSPNTISLPSGPGSIEGLGESFQPMLNTGTAKYAVKIALPPGAGGHTPKLSLNYESGHGDGPIGIGWKFGPGCISRQTDKGIPRYVDGPNGLDDDFDGEIDEPDEVDRFLGIEDEELVPLADGTYRARIEGTFVRYQRVGDHWIAHLKDGTRLDFGFSPGARVTDKTGKKIFKWLLERSTDTNGNVIQFFYTNFGGSDNQKYLKEVRYGPGQPPWSVFYFVHMTYEDRLDWRKDYRSGFLIKTAKRLKQIDIGIQGILPDQCAQGDWNKDEIPDALIRRYVLSYDDRFPHATFLTKVTLYGSDGVSYLPPISFTYSLFSPEKIVSAEGSLIQSDNTPSSVMDSELVELIDLNRDGLPDLLQTDLYGARHLCYFNLGVKKEGSTQRIQWDDPRVVTSPDNLAAQLHLTDKKVHLADMDGDGISDLVHIPYSGEVFYHLNTGKGSWSKRKRMSIQDTAPPAPFTNKDVRVADLDFDKRMDIVMSTDRGYSIWFNRGESKYSREVRTDGAAIDGWVIRFSETGVHLADMNGDRMNDVVKIRPHGVIYCANMGHGHFDKPVGIAIPDEVLTDGTNGQVEKARLKDINGDGL
ncbi:MAG TPA: hypothetical protein ENF86_01215, partial [Firmicutes bacterium]|nr:hypothetical protein [Bacillota bacterium]